MMEAVSISETLVNFYEPTRRNIPEDSHVHTRCRWNLKSHFVCGLLGCDAVLSCRWLPTSWTNPEHEGPQDHMESQRRLTISDYLTAKLTKYLTRNRRLDTPISLKLFHKITTCIFLSSILIQFLCVLFTVLPSSQLANGLFPKYFIFIILHPVLSCKFSAS
jgi:hypothetical protein